MATIGNALRGATLAITRSRTAPRVVTASASRYFSANPHVVVDKFVSSPPPTSSSANAETLRHPNDVHDRNANYSDEDSRSMAGVTASVRHNWTKQEIAEIYSH